MAVVFTESSLSKCLFNPMSKHIKDEMSARLPQIREYKPGRGGIPIESILKYLILTYDIQSPLHKEAKDYYSRKREAAVYAEFPTKDGKWRDDAQSILIGTDKWFNGLLAQYLSLQATPEYVQLIIYLELLARRTRDILDGSVDDKTHLVVKSLTESIREMTDKVFGSAGDDEVQAARQALYAQAEADRVRMRPEDIINMMNETGELPESWSPYGKLQKGKVEFIGDVQPVTDEA